MNYPDHILSARAIRQWSLRGTQQGVWTQADGVERAVRKAFAHPLLRLLLLCAMTILLFKIPYFLHRKISEPIFLTRYVPMIIFNGLILYTFCTQADCRARAVWQYFKILTALIGLSALIPPVSTPATHVADACLGIMSWFLWFFIHNGFVLHNPQKRLQFIRLNIIALFLSAVFLGVLVALVGITMGVLSAHKIYFLQYCFKDVIRSNAVLVPLVSLHMVHTFRRTYSFSRIRSTLDVLTPLSLFILLLVLSALALQQIPLLHGANLLAKLSILSFFSLGLLLTGTAFLDSDKEVARSAHMFFLLPIGFASIILNLLTLYASVSYVRSAGVLVVYPWIILSTNLLLLGHMLVMLRTLARVYFYRKNVSLAQQSALQYMNVYAISVFMMFIIALCYQLFFAYLS